MKLLTSPRYKRSNADNFMYVINAFVIGARQHSAELFPGNENSFYSKSNVGLEMREATRGCRSGNLKFDTSGTYTRYTRTPHIRTYVANGRGRGILSTFNQFSSDK